MNLSNQQNCETSQWQGLDRLVTLAFEERMMMRALRANRDEQVRIKHSMGIYTTRRGKVPRIALLVGALLLFTFSAIAQSPFKTALDSLTASNRAVLAAAPIPQVTATLMWDGAPGETNKYDFAGYVISWSTNVDMNNAAVVLLPVIWGYRFTNLPTAKTFYFTCTSYGTKDSKGMDRGVQIAPPAKLTWNRTEPPPAQAFIYVEGGTNSASGPFYGVDDLPQYVITNLTLRPYGIWRARIEYK